MDNTLVDLISALNIAQLIAMGCMFLFFYTRIEKKIEKIEMKIEKLDRRKY